MLVKPGCCDQRGIADQRPHSKKKIYVVTICEQNVNPERRHMERDVTRGNV